MFPSQQQMAEVKTPVDEKPVLADQADMDGASALAALASAASLAQNTSVKQEAKGIKNEYDEVRTYATYRTVHCNENPIHAVLRIRISFNPDSVFGQWVLMTKNWKNLHLEKNLFFLQKLQLTYPYVSIKDV